MSLFVAPAVSFHSHLVAFTPLMTTGFGLTLLVLATVLHAALAGTVPSLILRPVLLPAMLSGLVALFAVHHVGPSVSVLVPALLGTLLCLAALRVPLTPLGLVTAPLILPHTALLPASLASLLAISTFGSTLALHAALLIAVTVHTALLTAAALRAVLVLLTGLWSIAAPLALLHATLLALHAALLTVHTALLVLHAALLSGLSAATFLVPGLATVREVRFVHRVRFEPALLLWAVLSPLTGLLLTSLLLSLLIWRSLLLSTLVPPLLIGLSSLLTGLLPPLLIWRSLLLSSLLPLLLSGLLSSRLSRLPPGLLPLLIGLPALLTGLLPALLGVGVLLPELLSALTALCRLLATLCLLPTAVVLHPATLGVLSLPPAGLLAALGASVARRSGTAPPAGVGGRVLISLRSFALTPAMLGASGTGVVAFAALSTPIGLLSPSFTSILPAFVPVVRALDVSFVRPSVAVVSVVHGCRCVNRRP